MQGSGVGGATRNRLDEPEDDWLGDISDYDWSENAAEHAGREQPAPGREGDVAAVDDTNWVPPATADARRAVVERRRIVAGLVVAAVLGVVIVVALLLLRGGSDTPVSDTGTTTPSLTTSTPSPTPTPTPETPSQETPTQETPSQETPATTTPSTTPPANVSSFTLPAGTKLRLGEGDPEVAVMLAGSLRSLLAVECATAELLLANVAVIGALVDGVVDGSASEVAAFLLHTIDRMQARPTAAAAAASVVGDGARVQARCAKVLADIERTPHWVEETLRYDTSSQLLARVTTRDIELFGQRIPKGGRVALLAGSANRDGDFFADPDRYDLDRDTTGIASFGFGRHFCLGASLARLEARVVLEELLKRVGTWDIDPAGAKRVHSVNVRGFERLPTTVTLR